jgi:hypothetical protein
MYLKKKNYKAIFIEKIWLKQDRWKEA